MKKLILMATITLFASAVNAQEFIKINETGDNKRGLELSAVGYFGTENRYGAQVAYEIQPLTAFFEVTVCSDKLGDKYENLKYQAPSFRFGMDYGFFEYDNLSFFAGAFLGITAYSTKYIERDNNIYVPSQRLIKVNETGFIFGLKLGAKYELTDNMFIRAAAFANTNNWGRSIGKHIAKDARGSLDAGVNLALGWRF